MCFSSLVLSRWPNIFEKRPKTIVLVTNRVPVARFGLKLSQNESYGLQEHF